MDNELMLNKLEIHFSKSRNGGGEVEECEMLPDSGTVVVTFVKNDSEQTQYLIFNTELMMGYTVLWLQLIQWKVTEREFILDTNYSLS